MVVAYLEGFSAFDHSCHQALSFTDIAWVFRYHLRCEVSGYYVQERRLTGTVATHDSYLLVSLEVICESVQVTVIPVVEAEVLAVDDLGSESCSSLKLCHVHLLGRICLRGPVLKVIERIDPVSGLSCPRTRCAAYPLQFPAQDIPYFVGFSVIIGYTFLAFLQIVLIIALVGVYCTPVHFHHYVAHSVEEVSVVCDHQESAA